MAWRSGEHRGDGARLGALPGGREARRAAADAVFRRLEVAMQVTVAAATGILRLPYFPAMALAAPLVHHEPVVHGDRADERQRRIAKLDAKWRWRDFLSLLLGAVILMSGEAQAQEWPRKAVRIIVPFAPGGVADNSARVVAEPLAARLGQPVVVENKPGASGNIGTQAVAEAPPDGYTLLLGFDGTMVINPHVFAKVPFDTLYDFAPITKLGDATLILVAHPSLRVKNLAELVALSRTRPLAYGTSGTGGTPHPAAEPLKHRTRPSPQPVPS